MGGLLNWCTCRGTSPSRRPRFINISLIMFTYWGVKMCLQSTVYRAKVRTCDNDLGSVCWAQYYVSVSFRKWWAFIQCKGQIFYAVGIHVTVSHLEKINCYFQGRAWSSWSCVASSGPRRGWSCLICLRPSQKQCTHTRQRAVQSYQSPSERIRPVYVTACHFFLSWWLDTASVSVLPS